MIDRADKKFVSEYSSDLNKPALYILVNRDKRQLYVGETDDSIKRLRNHEAKDFWTEAIVFHSTTDTLSRFCKHFMPDEDSENKEYQGPAHFLYNGRTLDDIRKEKEKK